MLFVNIYKLYRVMYNYSMTIKEQLSFIQKVTGFSQERLAQKLGVTFSTLNSWINERSYPRLQAQERVELLYKEMTGQKEIPKNILEAKKEFVLEKGKKFSSILEVILKNKDINDQFLLSLTYNTNSIEGSTLTEPETAAILFQNVALPNKTLIEQMEAKNHQAALNYLLNYLQHSILINEALVLRLHGMLMNGIHGDAGLYRRHAVRIVGSNVPTSNYLKIQKLMTGLTDKLSQFEEDPIGQIAQVHSQFEQIHPFADGNGRIGRLLMHAMALRVNLPPVSVAQEKKMFYYTYLSKSQLSGDSSLLEDFICDGLLQSFKTLEREL